MTLYLLAAITFVLFLSTQVGAPALPLLAAELHAGPQETALVLSSALMTLVALQFVSGALADRFGRRRVLIAGAALGGLTSLLCAVAADWPTLLVLRILGGAADAIALPALLGLTAEIAAGRQGAFFGVLRSSQGLSFIVAPSIGGWLSLYSLRAPFVVDGLLSFAACGVLFALVHDRGRVHEHPLRLGDVGQVFAQPRVYAFALFCAVNNFAFPILSTFIAIKAVSLGYAAWQIAVLLAMEAVGFAAASFLVGRLSDRLGRRPFVIAAQPLVLVACLGLAFSRDLLQMTAWYTLFGLAGGTTFLLGLVMMADVTPADHAAATLGLFDSVVDLVLFVAPPVGITLSGWVGPDAVMAFAGVVAACALPAALATRETRGALRAVAAVQPASPAPGS